MLSDFWATVCKTVRPVLMLSDRFLPCPVLFCLYVTLVCCGQTVRWIKMKLCMQVGLGLRGHIVLDGDRVSFSPKGAPPPQLLAHICCGQMAGWIKMSLSMIVGLGPGNIVLDADPAPPEGVQPLQFLVPCLLWPNGWMDQDSSW